MSRKRATSRETAPLNCFSTFRLRLFFLVAFCQFVVPFQVNNKTHRNPLQDCDSQTALQAKAGESNAFDKGTTLFKVGKWEELENNFILRPSIEHGPPRAVIHFLGGALVGASPHISYRYVLERLAEQGFLIIATPYTLSFDHLSTCDMVISRFERIAGQIAQTYGALPVIGMGHSCGALLQVLITSLFPDTPRAANALLSFNNKPVTEAVPFFEEVFVPFFTYAAALNETSRPRGSDIINTGLRLAQSAAKGEIPSDELLSKAFRLLVPPPFYSRGPYASEDSFVVPRAVRDAFLRLTAPTTSALSNAEIVPLVVEVLQALEQIPGLIDEVALGARDFDPTPIRVKEAARRAYRARRTLIIKYTDDPIDESNEIEELLQAAGQIAAMKRPMMVDIDVQRRDLPGGHAAPLIAPPLELAKRIEDILGADAAKEGLRYTEADETVSAIVRWLEDSEL